MKLIMFLFLLAFSSELAFKDSYGNEFVIENSETLPKGIDLEFLKTNLNTNHFIEKYTPKSYSYKFTVIYLKKKTSNVYELKVQTKTGTQDKNDIEEISKYLYPSYYTLKTKLVNGKLKLESVKFKCREI